MADVRRWIATGSSQNVLFSSRRVPEDTGHSVGTLHGQKTEESVREGLMALRSSGASWNSEINQLPRSFTGLLQIYCDETATSLKLYTLVAYPDHVVRMSTTERRTRNLGDQKYFVEVFSG